MANPEGFINEINLTNPVTISSNSPVRLAALVIQSFALSTLPSARELRIMICCRSRHVTFLLVKNG